MRIRIHSPAWAYKYGSCIRGLIVVTFCLEKLHTMKVRLEEKQRACRRQREVEAELAQQEGREFTPYSPIWYKQVRAPAQYSS